MSFKISRRFTTDHHLKQAIIEKKMYYIVSPGKIKHMLMSVDNFRSIHNMLKICNQVSNMLISFKLLILAIDNVYRAK